MRVTSLGFRTDVALRAREGAEVADRGDCLVVRSPNNPDYWWGNFLLLAAWPVPGTGDRWLARFAAEFPLAHHITLGVDSDPSFPDDEDDRPVPAEFLAAGLKPERDTVLTCAAVRPRASQRAKPRSGGWNPTPTGSSLLTWASAVTATTGPRSSGTCGSRRGGG